jgi:hypothetical protein
MVVLLDGRGDPRNASTNIDVQRTLRHASTRVDAFLAICAPSASMEVDMRLRGVRVVTEK